MKVTVGWSETWARSTVVELDDVVVAASVGHGAPYSAREIRLYLDTTAVDDGGWLLDVEQLDTSDDRASFWGADVEEVTLL